MCKKKKIKVRNLGKKKKKNFCLSSSQQISVPFLIGLYCVAIRSEQQKMEQFQKIKVSNPIVEMDGNIAFFFFSIYFSQLCFSDSNSIKVLSFNWYHNWNFLFDAKCWKTISRTTHLGEIQVVLCCVDVWV